MSFLFIFSAKVTTLTFTKKGYKEWGKVSLTKNLYKIKGRELRKINFILQVMSA